MCGDARACHSCRRRGGLDSAASTPTGPFCRLLLAHSLHARGGPHVNLFPPYANQLLWIGIGAIGAAIVGIPTTMIAWARTAYATGKDHPSEQPIKFDHRHHVRDDGITCVYCHKSAFDGPSAGIPATALCMNCHSQVWTHSPELSAVRRSYFDDEPIHWRRVNRLPDFVFFDHSAHVNHGVGCVSCHGRVDLMPEVYAAAPLTMRWCLDCHREPEKHLRPLDQVTNMAWRSERPQLEVGRELRAALGVRSLTHCTTCHR